MKQFRGNGLDKYNPTALRGFIGLEKAIQKLNQVHSFTMYLGFGLGLLKRSKAKTIKFHVDCGGYEPSILSRKEWADITGSSRFHLVPQYVRKGVFHSKAWFFKSGVLLGSSNLSIREARESLNFWCWIPHGKWHRFAEKIQKRSCTLYWDLNRNAQTLGGTPLTTIKKALGKSKLKNIVIISPQNISKNLIEKLSTNMSLQGDCRCFLAYDSQGIKYIKGRGKWNISNYISANMGIGLHGKAFYGEWEHNNTQGAILYLGSANFTYAAYTGCNIESGIVIRAEGTNKVRELQDAVSCLLGKSGAVSTAENAWATERFDGRWSYIIAPDGGEQEKDSISWDDNTDEREFIAALIASNNCLYFPAKYGDKRITKAVLEMSPYHHLMWTPPMKRRFPGTVWMPEINLCLTLAGGKAINIDIPPLEGLMDRSDRGSSLISLMLADMSDLFRKSVPKGEEEEPTDDISIYSGSRVLVPWRNIVRDGHLSLLKDRKELIRTLNIISKMSEEARFDDEKVCRKLKNIEFCIRCLLEHKL
jgi:hypothetical protein